MSSRVALTYRAHVNARRLGLVLFAPLDVILSDRPGGSTILQPDLIDVDDTRHGVLHMRGIEGAPTLVVEILSPSTATINRLVATVTGTEPVDLPPFEGLGLVPSSLWT